MSTPHLSVVTDTPTVDEIVDKILADNPRVSCIHFHRSRVQLGYRVAISFEGVSQSVALHEDHDTILAAALTAQKCMAAARQRMEVDQ